MLHDAARHLVYWFPALPSQNCTLSIIGCYWLHWREREWGPLHCNSVSTSCPAPTWLDIKSKRTFWFFKISKNQLDSTEPIRVIVWCVWDVNWKMASNRPDEARCVLVAPVQVGRPASTSGCGPPGGLLSRSGPPAGGDGSQTQVAVQPRSPPPQARPPFP